MPTSPAERVRELTAAVATLTERLDNAREAIVHLRQQLEDERTQGRSRDVAIRDACHQADKLRERFDDQVKRTETWSNRAWGLFVVLVAALMSLATTLIVTLWRK